MSAERRKKALPEIRSKLLTFELPETLALRYKRSHMHLSKRLESIDWDALLTVSSENISSVCQQLIRHWPEICGVVSSQPMQIVMPGIHQQLTGIANNKPLIYNWTQWRWEPIGSGWPISTSGEQLQKALLDASIQRACLAHVNVETMTLIALLYEFERRTHSKDYTGAVKIIDQIHKAAKNQKLI